LKGRSLQRKRLLTLVPKRKEGKSVNKPNFFKRGGGGKSTPRQKSFILYFEGRWCGKKVKDFINPAEGRDSFFLVEGTI